MLAPPWLTVPPTGYGGTEQVVDDLSRGLAQRGHEVSLFTVGASTCPVDRRWTRMEPIRPMGLTIDEIAHAIDGYLALKDMDVIHDHTVAGAFVVQSLRRRGIEFPPIVVTHHGVFDQSARRVFDAAGREAAVVAISQDHARSAAGVPLAAVIPHGVDLCRYGYGDGDGGYLMFVGRMSPDKGLHRAIDVARRTGQRLVAVSKMKDEPEHRYYQDVIRPLLTDDITLALAPSAPERTELLRRATALLNPISWREPFGLVMAEALACGTPVLAYPHGAAGEIVTSGETGFLVNDESEMAAAVAGIGMLDRRRCRQRAVAMFDSGLMTRRYERLYRQVGGEGGPAQPSIPTQRSTLSQQALRVIDPKL